MPLYEKQRRMLAHILTFISKLIPSRIPFPSLYRQFISQLWRPLCHFLLLHFLACVLHLKPQFKLASIFFSSGSICLEMAGDNVAYEVEVEEETGKAVAEEEDTGAQVAPIVKLQEVSIATGEEEEDVMLDMKAKLYRFDKDGNQWKERGVGTVKLLKHKETGKVRLVMRQAKTLKICANHLVLPSISVQEHSGNDKSCVWHAPDFSDGELKEELFCIRFATVENAKKFMEMVEEIAKSQDRNSEEEDEAADKVAEVIRELKIEDGNKTQEIKKELKEDTKEEKKEKLEKLETKDVAKEEAKSEVKGEATVEEPLEPVTTEAEQEA